MDYNIRSGEMPSPRKQPFVDAVDLVQTCLVNLDEVLAEFEQRLDLVLVGSEFTDPGPTTGEKPVFNDEPKSPAIQRVNELADHLGVTTGRLRALMRRISL